MLMLLLLLFYSILTQADIPLPPETTLRKVSESREWLRLLHYKPTYFFGRLRSEIDGGDFFLSPDGNSDPYAELVADIQAFTVNDRKIGKLKQTPQCAFPLRLEFIKKNLGLTFNEGSCEEYKAFMDRFSPSSTTLVFSSAYPNNPGSMFGHTFLRVNSAKVPHNDLLDQGVSYAAVVGDDENTFAFIWGGLMGGYIGQYSVLPYYVKVNEYSHAESRDLWEYDLGLSAEETRRLVAHTWEVETNGYKNYFFLDENCSYEIMILLEVAKLDWNLLTFPLFIVPAETIKTLRKTPGAITRVNYRPSLQRRMARARDDLNSDDRKAFDGLIGKKIALSDVSNTNVLDAYLIYLQYQKQEAGKDYPPEAREQMKAALIRRSQLPQGNMAGPDWSKMHLSRPDYAHGPAELGLHYGQENTEGFLSGSFEFAYHDLLNPDRGFTPFSQIQFPNFEFNYFTERKELQWTRLEFFSVISLFPFETLERRISWKVRVGFFPFRDLAPRLVRLFHFETEAGLSFSPFSKNLIFYSLLGPNIEAGPALKRGYRAGLKSESALLASFFSKLKAGPKWETHWEALKGEKEAIFHEFGAQASYSPIRDWEFRAEYSKILHTASTLENYAFFKLGILYYF